jgi:hypothetical protein
MTWSLSLITRGYDRVAEEHKVLSDDTESELDKHIRDLSDQLKLLSKPQMERTCPNNIVVPDNW